MRVIGDICRVAGDWPVQRKMVMVFFVGIVCMPLTVFILLQSEGVGVTTNFLIGVIVASIILLVPIANWMSQVLALRSIKELNEQCRLLKEGHYDQVALPPAEDSGHDFVTLKRNMHWMGHTIATRERKLQVAMTELAEAQRQIGESLDYARLIQTSFLPGRIALSQYLSEFFLIWEQRDAVGGDAYWLKPTDSGFFIGVIDCTGHGVPGAFMTLIVTSLLEKAAADGTASPAVILGRMNRLIKDALGQNHRGAKSDDGMDCALCHVESNGSRVVFAGANTPLYVLDGEGVRRIKGDRCGLGYVRSDPDFAFSDTVLHLCRGDRIYLVSDGLPDQVGGDRGFPFGRRRFTHFIADGRNRPIDAQGTELMQALLAYQGNETRRDDMTVIGFEL